MFMSTILDEFKCSGAVMITASHLPFNRNGFKFFVSEGGLEKADISAILKTASELTPPVKILSSEGDKLPLMERYASLFVEKIKSGIKSCKDYEKPLSGMKIIVDAGNGAGGFFVDKVLAPLGADSTGSQFLEPDGMFPNHEPNPENDEAMQSIQKAVINSNADLGIIFDTDVDRAAVVDSTGEIINRNTLIALIAAIVLEEHPGTTIVTDSVTSDGLTDFIEKKLGGKHLRFKRGYKNVINEAVRLNNTGEECHLAIETSGHGAMKENYFLDDGAYLVAKILIFAARLRLEKNAGLLSMLEGLKQPVEEKEFRVKLLDEDFAAQGEKIINGLKSFIQNIDGWTPAPVNHEGLRISSASADEKGWFLLRLSLHDPVLPLNIESEVHGGVKIITVKLSEFFKQFSNINYDALVKYCRE
jgi:phosphomannomutase